MRGVEVIGKFVINGKRAFRREVEDVTIFFVKNFAVLRVAVGILCAEGGLHIFRGAFQVTQHKYARPFGNCHAGSKLTNA